MIYAKRFFLFVILILLVACQDDSLKNPQSKDLVGQWERASIGGLIPYILIDFQLDGSARVFNIGNHGEVLIEGYISSFKSKDRGFEVVVNLIRKKIEPIVGIGSIHAEGKQMCLNFPFEKHSFDERLCFTRSSEVLKHRKAVFDFLKEEKNR